MANYADFNDTSISTLTSLPALASTNETAKPFTAYSTMTGGNDIGVSIAALTLLCVVFATL
ncbi:hypothetical protein D0868_14444 [Hortaea werneckii]|uniref:Uncharacterized protein n=1 Tax=Hortaea werneckii TaxID=91943 RepID=A0A3M6XIP8_HORWE|nr:hypothetical protein D0868_14444 [Hortaea werneckii]